MLKIIRRTLAGILAGASMHEASGAAHVPSAQIETDAEAALKAVTYDHHAMVRPEYLAMYKGPGVKLSDSMLAVNANSRKWRNYALAGQSQTEKFIEERTR